MTHDLSGAACSLSSGIVSPAIQHVPPPPPTTTTMGLENIVCSKMISMVTMEAEVEGSCSCLPR